MRSPTQQTLKRWRFRSGWRPNLFSLGQPHHQDLILVTRTNLIGSDRVVDCQLALKTSKEPFLIATNGLLFENLRPPLTGLLIKNNYLTLKFYIKSNFSHILRRFEQNASTTETKCSSSLSPPEDSTESSGASLRSLSLVSVVSGGPDTTDVPLKRSLSPTEALSETKCSSSLSPPEDSAESSGASLRSLSLVSVVSERADAMGVPLKRSLSPFEAPRKRSLSLNGSPLEPWMTLRMAQRKPPDRGDVAKPFWFAWESCLGPS